MRRVFLGGGLVGLIAVAGAALAQSGGGPPVPPPAAASPPATVTPQAGAVQPAAPPASSRRVMAVTAARALVRSGPGDGCYPTAELARGQPVVVLRESAKNKGWLEIEPPHGSYSWINTRFVRRTGERSGTVHADKDAPAPVMAGKSLPPFDEEPSIEVARAPAGTLVAILGPEATSKQGTGQWLPIQPLLEEVRYIKASDVGAASEVQTASAQGAALGGFQGSTVYGGDGRVAKVQADKLFNEALALYEQAANDPNLDPAARQQMLQRIQALRAQPLAAPGHPSHAGASQHPVQGQTVGLGQQSGTNPSQSMYSTGPRQGPHWSPWGVLRKTAMGKDGQTIYALVDERGATIVYGVPEPGMTLDPYIGRRTALYGTVTYRSDETLRDHIMTVRWVAPPQ